MYNHNDNNTSGRQNNSSSNKNNVYFATGNDGNNPPYDDNGDNDYELGADHDALKKETENQARMQLEKSRFKAVAFAVKDKFFACLDHRTLAEGNTRKPTRKKSFSSEPTSPITPLLTMTNLHFLVIQSLLTSTTSYTSKKNLTTTGGLVVWSVRVAM